MTYPVFGPGQFFDFSDGNRTRFAHGGVAGFTTRPDTEGAIMPARASARRARGVIPPEPNRSSGDATGTTATAV